MFKVITEKYNPVNIYYIVLDLLLQNFFCFLSRKFPLAFIEELMDDAEFFHLLLVCKALDFSLKYEKILVVWNNLGYRIFHHFKYTLIFPLVYRISIEKLVIFLLGVDL